MVADSKSQTSSKPLNKGDYTYVGLDIDTTGRRLIDEIVNIAAYTPESQFSQYIMPLMNLNPGARNRHKIMVINVRSYRMLKSMKTYNVIKTKTEVFALMDFLEWIESLDTKDGVIFVYHEQKKFIPMMIIEAMRKYRLMERFEKVVKSFVNGFELGEKDNNGGLKYLTLKQNREVQMEKLGIKNNTKEEDEFEGDAAVRAKLSYEIVKWMSYGGTMKEIDDKQLQTQLNEFIRVKVQPLYTELEDIAEQEECIKRQSSLSDIFRTYFQTSRYCRKLAVTFRRLLAEEKYDLDSLKMKYDEGKRDALIEVVKKLKEIKEEEQIELVEILDSHFDPEKKPLRPIKRRDSQNNNNGGMRPRRRRGGMSGPRNSRGSTTMMDKENNRDRARSNSNRRRRRSVDNKRFGPNNNDNMMHNNNNNNNNVMDKKTGTIRKEPHHDANANNIVTAAH
jgi:maternal-effect protein exuperantia